MIKKLRHKFVFITMLLMTVTFGILFITDNLFTKYLEEQEMLQRLNWYAKSDSFFEFAPLDESAPDEYGYPIFAIELDPHLNIQSIQSSSKTGRKTPTEKEIRLIAAQSPERHKWNSYLYVLTEQPDGYLLVITDTSMGTDSIPRILGDILLICAGFTVLLVVSLFLSRFVTEPAKNALEREKQFISNASHELKTPLAAINVNAHALQADLADNRHLKNILSEIRRMDALIQKLLKLSYLEESGAKIEKRQFSLSACCEEMALSMESNIYEQKINFDYDIEENLTYYGNESDIKQVIVILLDNAIKHTPESGTISLKLALADSVPTLTVTNCGQGISPEDLPYIFDRFYRIDAARTGEDNSYGLGLSIAKAITDAHAAEIRAESEFGQSTTFTVRFFP